MEARKKIGIQPHAMLKSAPRTMKCVYCGAENIVVDRVTAMTRHPKTNKLEHYGIDLTGRSGGASGAGVIAHQVTDEIDQADLNRRSQGRHVVLAMRGLACGHQYNLIINCPDPTGNGGTYVQEVDQFVSPLVLPGNPEMDERVQKLPALWAQLLSIMTVEKSMLAQWMRLGYPAWGEQGVYPMLIINFRAQDHLAAKALALKDNVQQIITALQILDKGCGIQIAIEGQFITS